MAHSYAETYAVLCQSAVETLQTRLGREVSQVERRSIWNIGSLMMLEGVEQTFREGSLTDVAHELRAMPEWTDKRFQEALSSILARFPTWLGRAATEGEKSALGRMEHIGALARFEERLMTISPELRETVVRDMLFPSL